MFQVLLHGSHSVCSTGSWFCDSPVLRLRFCICTVSLIIVPTSYDVVWIPSQTACHAQGTWSSVNVFITFQLSDLHSKYICLFNISNCDKMHIKSNVLNVYQSVALRTLMASTYSLPELFSSHKTETARPINRSSISCNSNHPFIFCEFDYSRYLIHVESHSNVLLDWPISLNMLSHVSEFPSFIKKIFISIL